MNDKLTPGERIAWALGGLYYDGQPRVIKTGEVYKVHSWGYSCFADDSPRYVTDTYLKYPLRYPFTFSVEFKDVLPLSVEDHAQAMRDAGMSVWDIAAKLDMKFNRIP